MLEKYQQLFSDEEREAIKTAIDIAQRELNMEEQFVIHTPLMWIDKCETWALADELGVLDLVRHRTLTCYNGVVGDGCGHCPACKLRREGLEEYLKIKNENK